MSQEILPILISDPEDGIALRLSDLLEQGYYIHSCFPDMDRQGKHESMYVAVVSKHYTKPKHEKVKGKFEKETPKQVYEKFSKGNPNPI